MHFSSEKVALLSGSMSQQLSVITLYLWQTGRRHKRAWRDARRVATCTTSLTAQDCSCLASSACYHWKWPLQHLNNSSGGRAFGLLRDQQYKGHHSHQTHMQWIHISMHTTDPTHIGATPVWPCGSWNSFTEYAPTNPECRSTTEPPQRTT